MNFNIFDILAISSSVFLLTFLYARSTRRKKSPPPPPGPKGLPIIGNILDLPSDYKNQIKFAEWGDLYGDICSISILGRPFIILNSARAANEMLDKKSSIYSDRPAMTLAGELVGWKYGLGMITYGSRWRAYRKMAHSIIGTPSAVKHFHPAHEVEFRRFLRRLYGRPEDLKEHIQFAIGASSLRAIYGHEAADSDDRLLKLVQDVMEAFSEMAAPPGYAVDFFPFLKYLPSWFPGAKFKRQARKWRKDLDDMIEVPFEMTKDQMRKGDALVSFVQKLLSEEGRTSETELCQKWTALSLYAGAADTTVSAIYSFFLAMIIFPEAAQQAQAEIDAVVGSDRLPTFDDRPNLPYMNALVKEVHRFHSVGPLAIPHLAMEDEIHDGYFIPKGSLILPNLWKMTHDPKVYQDPFTFSPDRYLGPNSETDPKEYCFGFGRRICPGIYFADQTVFIACAMTLAVFNIEKVEGDKPVYENTAGVISHPKPFNCTIKPRSEKAVSLIMDEVQLGF